MYYVLPKNFYETKIFLTFLKIFSDGMSSENRSKINRFWVSKSLHIHDFHLKSIIFMVLDRKIRKKFKKNHCRVIGNAWNVSKLYSKWVLYVYYVLPKKNYEMKCFSISLKMFADGMASENRSKINRFWFPKTPQIDDFHGFGSKNPQKIKKNYCRVSYIVWNAVGNDSIQSLSVLLHVTYKLDT